MSQYREMRAFVIFDLPTTTKNDIKVYNNFRKNLLKDGFLMMQYSSYSRFCRNDTEYHKVLRRIKVYTPRNVGNIRIFHITERQYQKMVIYSSENISDDKLLGANPLVVIE